MAECTLHIGSNIGFKKINLELARIMISNHIGPLNQISGLYETEAWGVKEQDSFINQAIIVNTSLRPMEVLSAIQHIESKMGRIKDLKWGPRIIDIDIIFYANEIIKNHQLKIPHSELSNRNFVLIPLMDICAEKIHPIFKKTVRELAKECSDKGIVKKI